MKHITFFAAMAFALPALAQSVVGTSVVDGKVVALYSDGTWRAAGDTATSGCTDLSAGMQFCPTDPKWQRIRASTPQVDATFQYDDRHYGQFVVEEIGKADGLTAEGLREAVLTNAEGASGKPAAVLDVTPSEVAGLPAETMTYVVEFQGTQFVFATTTVLTDHLTAQIQTWQLGGAPYTETHRKLHADFLTATRVEVAKNE